MRSQSLNSGKNLLKSTSIVSSMTLICRIFGFVREMILAYAFGASGGMDAFIIAFKLPNFMRRLFAEGAFSQAFVPVLSEYRTQKPDEIKIFINHMAGSLGVILLLVVGIATIASPVLVHIFAPGFGQASVRFELASHMLRITFPYLFFISLTAFAGAILNTYSRFAIPAITPVLLNIVLITAAIFIAPRLETPIVAIAWAVFIAGIVQLTLQLPFLKRVSHIPKPIPNWRDPGVKRVLRLMVPALFGVSVVQLSILIDSIFASFLQVGSVSWLYYSDRLTNFPLGVFGIALATVVLPHLSKQQALNDQINYAKTLDWAVRSVLLVGIPSMVGLAMLAGPILATLLGHGHFDMHDVVMTQHSLIAFALGVPFFMLVKVLVSGFYAKQNIRTPVRIAFIAMLVNVVLNAALIVPLAHAGLALATSLAAVVNAGLLFIKLYRKKIFVPSAKWNSFLLRLLLANSVMIVLLWSIRQPLTVWLDWSYGMRFLQLGWVIGAAMIVYLGLLRLTGFRLSNLWIVDQETH